MIAEVPYRNIKRPDSVDNHAAETGFKAIQAVHGMPGIVGRRNPVEIIGEAAAVFGILYSLPLQKVCGHQIAALI